MVYVCNIGAMWLRESIPFRKMNCLVSSTGTNQNFIIGCQYFLKKPKLSNLEMEAECLTKTLSYLNLNISRRKNGRNKL